MRSRFWSYASAVCYRGDLPGTYAHEILHLFGAWDMYKRDFDKANARESKCKLYFSRSIMHQPYYYEQQEIDEINA